jgi:pyruvate/2-oxoglutarate dehydrogenase complex dihydrolipoamide dehydrogenase (E3) component
MQPEEFDLVMLGGGTGSTVAAWTFAGEGKRVAVVDRKYIGGSCPNIACLPSKNIIHSAKIASYIRRSKEFGISLDGFTIDMSGVRDRKRKMVTGLNDMYLENYRNTGAMLIHRSEDCRGHSREWNQAPVARHRRDRKYRYASYTGSNPWSRRSRTTHAC